MDRSMLLNEDDEPNVYLEQVLAAEGKNWYAMTEAEHKVFIDNLLTISNIFTKEERVVEMGDDLARERELFWDNYY
ncbi:MAG: hypothetical protein LUC37_02910, partial [Prevotella sp.]|nr:hypothetical protein [Prevotella sp.]